MLKSKVESVKSFSSAPTHKTPNAVEVNDVLQVTDGWTIPSPLSPCFAKATQTITILPYTLYTVSLLHFGLGGQVLKWQASNEVS